MVLKSNSLEGVTKDTGGQDSKTTVWERVPVFEGELWVIGGKEG